MSQELSPEDEELLREEMKALTAYYRRTALNMIRDAKHRKQKEEPYAYRDLANDLLQYGVDIDHQVLINRLNREAFSFTFALPVLATLGVTHITIPRLSPELAPSFTRS